MRRKARKRSTDFSRNEGEELSVVQVINAVERKGNKILKVVETKGLTEDSIENALNGKWSNLISDKHPSYKAFGKSNSEIIHKSYQYVRLTT